MQSESDQSGAQPGPPPKGAGGADLDFTRTPRNITELLTDPGFPKSAVGALVDFGGYTGIVTEIVNQSLKVRSPEGGTKSFNVNGLRRIYGPRPEPPPPRPALEPPPEVRRPLQTIVRVERTERVEKIERIEKVEPVVEPDFSKPVRKIGDVVANPGFPQTALGEHVEIAGYTGVVVQIHNRSLKVRSQGEITRSYNADALRKLYGQ